MQVEAPEKWMEHEHEDQEQVEVEEKEEEEEAGNESPDRRGAFNTFHSSPALPPAARQPKELGP